jgi:hypothetical protein
MQWENTDPTEKPKGESDVKGALTFGELSSPMSVENWVLDVHPKPDLRKDAELPKTKLTAKVEFPTPSMEEMLKELELQKRNITKLMEDWENLIKWASSYPRKYLPRTDLLDFLRKTYPL